MFSFIEPHPVFGGVLVCLTYFLSPLQLRKNVSIQLNVLSIFSLRASEQKISSISKVLTCISVGSSAGFATRHSIGTCLRAAKEKSYCLETIYELSFGVQKYVRGIKEQHSASGCSFGSPGCSTRHQCSLAVHRALDN